MTLRPAFDIADGTVNGEPFQTKVARIDSTLPRRPSAIQRFPTSSVIMNDPRKTVLAMASNPRVERSSVRDTKLPAALLMRPVNGASRQMVSSSVPIASSDRMSQVRGVTRPPWALVSSCAVRSSTSCLRPQMTTSAPRARKASAISRPRPVPPPVTRIFSPPSRPSRNISLEASIA